MMLSLQTKIIGAVLAALLLFGAYSYVGYRAVEEYKAEQVEAQAKADVAQREKYETLEAELIVAKASRKTEFKTITRVVDKLVQGPEYQTQCITSEGLVEANKALSGGVPAEVKNELY